MSIDELYSPPSAPVSDTDGTMGSTVTGLQAISGKLLKATSPLALPENLCVKCGSHTAHGKQYEKKIYYSPRWIVITVLINLLVVLLLHLFLRKKLEVNYSLCGECVAKRKKRILVSGAAVVGSLFGFGFGVVAEIFPLVAACGVGFIVALIALVVFIQLPLRATAHKSGLFSVKGGAPEFLDRLRDRPAQESTSW